MSNKKITDDKHKGSSSEAGLESKTESKDKHKRGSFFDWVDAGLKIVIAIVGIWVSYLGYNYQKSSTASLLLIQQEKGDTDIRAQMFGKITDRLMRPKEGEESLVPDSLLVQMLALNFHELIELKPLMLNLDTRLKSEIQRPPKGSDQKNVAIQAQKNLRSVARRIRDRQVSTLIRHNGESNTNPGIRNDTGFVQYVSVLSKGTLEGSRCRVKDTNAIGKDGCLKESMELAGLRANQSMYFSIDEANWEDERFSVSIYTGEKKIQPSVEGTRVETCEDKSEIDDDEKNTEIRPGHTSFMVSWYDFPYTDNTLLANGDRYTVFIDRVCKNTEKKQNAVRLGLLYYPKDYYPSRERPISYKQLRGKLGMNSDNNLLF